MDVWRFVNGRRAAVRLISFCGNSLESGKGCRYLSVYTSDGEGAPAERMRKYAQHTGCGVSSRQAEDLLVERHLLSGIFKVVAFVGNAEAEAERPGGADGLYSS